MLSHPVCYKMFTACSKLVPTTCEQNYSKACEQTCYNLFADLLQLVVSLYACTNLVNKPRDERFCQHVHFLQAAHRPSFPLGVFSRGENATTFFNLL